MTTWTNLSTVDDFVCAYEKVLEMGDNRVEDMFLMQSPMPVIIIVASYIYFVTSLGPKLMADRKAFDLRSAISVYNVFQIIFNAGLFVATLDMWVRYYGWGLSCMPVMPVEQKPGDALLAARFCHLYFVNKVIDLLDTIFFVLKKKNDKITILHVFHHSVMPLSCWAGVKFHPGGNLAFFGLPNLFIHIWMYLYYLVAIMGPQYQKYIWWKRHLTEMQLGQFLIVGLYMGYVSHICNLNKMFTVWIFILDATFIGLFTNFYIKAYKRKRTREDAIKKEN